MDSFSLLETGTSRALQAADSHSTSKIIFPLHTSTAEVVHPSRYLIASSGVTYFVIAL